jgi:hypothetical protein
MPCFFDHFCRQWDVAGNDKVTRLESFYNLIVSNIKTGTHL